MCAVAGYRYYDKPFSGQNPYVDDLVTDAARRSQGHGAALLRWLVQEARRNGCVQLELDSGVQRYDAHRFYFRERMHVSAYHFVVELKAWDRTGADGEARRGWSRTTEHTEHTEEPGLGVSVCSVGHLASSGLL